MGLLREKCQIKEYHLKDNGKFPNSRLPVLHYRQAFDLPFVFAGFAIKRWFSKNNWKNAWRDSVLDYHHYHSNTHEVLGFYKGKTQLQLGGRDGVTITVEAGDVLIIPAGVAHKNLGSQKSVKCIGAYPGHRSYDMNYGSKGERPKADDHIRKVPLPQKDPVFGKKGGIKNYWKDGVWDLKKSY